MTLTGGIFLFLFNIFLETLKTYFNGIIKELEADLP